MCHGLILEIHSKLFCHRASLCIVGYVCVLWGICVGFFFFFKAGGVSQVWGCVCTWYGISIGCGPMLSIVQQVCMIHTDCGCGVECVLGL